MGFADLLATVDRAVVDSTLGDAVTYTPGTGDPVEVRGPFDLAYVLVEAGDAGISSQGPAVFLLLADLPSDPETDADARVTFDGVTYKPHTVKPDGMGGVLLLMHRD